MKMTIVLPAMAALFAFSTGSAQADPKNGFGINAGIITSRMNDPIAGSYQSTGGSLGLDYQFALTSSLSLNPFLMTSGESATGGNLASGTKASHGIAGLELRYWLGNAFLGGHLGSYTEVLSTTAGNVTTSTSANGGGLGLVAGWESPDSGLFTMGQLDTAKVHYTFSTTKVSSFRLSIGYRWK